MVAGLANVLYCARLVKLLYNDFYFDFLALNISLEGSEVFPKTPDANEVFYPSSNRIKT